MTETANRLDLAIVIVSFKVRELLERCLRSIERELTGSELRCQIVVVDNASHDGSAEMVRTNFPTVQLIALNDNLGFAGGNNAGLRRVLGLDGVAASADVPRYVLLLNPDTAVQAGALERLVCYLDEHPDVVVAGPQLRYGDGTLQSSRRRWPARATLFWESTLLEQWWPRNPWARRYRLDDRGADGVQEVDWLVGAALLVRSPAIAAAGLLDERYFMYSEELEWQSRLARHGRIVYLPEAVVIHYEGKSSEQNLARRHINFQRSKLRYAYRRWGRVLAESLRVFLLATYWLQLGVEVAKWLLGHKRELRRARIAQYGEVLRSGLRPGA